MSLTNNELKDIKSLKAKKERKAQDRFLAEGIRVLEEAVKQQVNPDLICWARSETDERGHKLIDAFQKAGVRAEELSAKQLHNICEAQSPQSVVGLFSLPKLSLAQLLDSSARRVLLCDGISDPGNLGTLIRSGLAFGFDRFILTGSSADPFAPKVVRSTAGAIFGIKIVRLSESEHDELVKAKEATKLKLIGAVALRRSVPPPLTRETVDDGVILAIGSEAEGLADNILKMIDRRITIRHTAVVESLNAGVAGSILMKQIYDLVE